MSKKIPQKIAFKNIDVLGYACGLAAGNPGCADGPVALKEMFENLELFYPDIHLSKNNKYKIIEDICLRLAKRTEKAVLNHHPFLVFAGDHSSAIGTWSGVSQGLRSDFGLIWVDAHMDAHTDKTTPSGNIHGMPVASLLGYGDKSLSYLLHAHPKVKPENLCYIGIRSYEPDEENLIKKLNIKTYYMDDIKQRGLESIFKEAKDHILKNTEHYGLSIDLDSLDPHDAPGVGTPESNGISAPEFINILKKYCHGDPKLLGAEITEYNPHLDINFKTQDIIITLTQALFG